MSTGVIPMMMTVVSLLAGEHQGRAQGTLGSAKMAAEILAPICFGSFFREMEWASFLVAAGFVGVAIVLSAFLRKEVFSDEPPDPETVPILTKTAVASSKVPSLQAMLMLVGVSFMAWAVYDTRPYPPTYTSLDCLVTKEGRRPTECTVVYAGQTTTSLTLKNCTASVGTNMTCYFVKTDPTIVYSTEEAAKVAGGKTQPPQVSSLWYPLWFLVSGTAMAGGNAMWKYRAKKGSVPGRVPAQQGEAPDVIPLQI